MVVTNINSPELGLYEKLNENFAKAFEIVKAAVQNVPEVGKYEVDGKNVYYMSQEYLTKAPGEAQFEAHKKYIDIQVVLDGEEIIRFDAPEKLSVTKEYDEVKDCMLFAMNREFDSVRLGKGDMTIIFPEEPHAPGIAADGTPARVRKAVVKVWW